MYKSGDFRLSLRSAVDCQIVDLVVLYLTTELLTCAIPRKTRLQTNQSSSILFSLVYFYGAVVFCFILPLPTVYMELSLKCKSFFIILHFIPLSVDNLLLLQRYHAENIFSTPRACGKPWFSITILSIFSKAFMSQLSLYLQHIFHTIILYLSTGSTS